MSVQVLVEWVSKCSWNHCPGVAGMSVQVLSEYASLSVGKLQVSLKGEFREGQTVLTSLSRSG